MWFDHCSILDADGQAESQVDMDWEEQRSELIDGLLSTSSPCQLAAQEAVSVLLYMAQDDSSASGSGAESPQVISSPGLAYKCLTLPTSCAYVGVYFAVLALCMLSKLTHMYICTAAHCFCMLGPVQQSRRPALIGVSMEK